MPTTRTPDVHVQEIPVSPSVAEVATGIPAFVGYTERAARGTEDLALVPTRISSLEEYEELFGRAHPAALSMTVRPDAALPGGFEVTAASSVGVPAYLLWYAVRLFFDNGGGPCWIVSVGGYEDPPAFDWDGELKEGLDRVALEDEPALVVVPEMVNLGARYGAAADAVLAQCGTLGDRFAILDVPGAVDRVGLNGPGGWRGTLGVRNLRYAAAYYPYLRTTLSPRWTEKGVAGDAHDSVTVTIDGDPGATNTKLSELATSRPGAHDFVRARLASTFVTLPPSGAVAGVYAATDRDRGVWKAPANVPLADVLEPAVRITAADQEDLNVDPGGGKSVNAIRSFTGRGTLVWGARTLAGNDDEWRYVPVRRFFSMVEESVKKSTSWAVFEPNDANLWAKVRGTIESYLVGRWRDGALAGAKPEDAFFVRCGLGTTMTAQDVLDGRMIVEVGMAVVRPAEFIVLRFCHEVQAS